MKKIICIGLFLCLCFSCSREEYSNIPYAPVNLVLYPEDMIQLTASPISFTKPRNASDQLGYGGILIVRDIYTPDAYYAYDLACPVEAQRNICIQPDDTGITATCSRCGSVFNIANGGYPESGTKLKLTRYQISAIGGGAYKVSH
ncbi:MAG: hypothetical protein LBC40_08105 [Dysgonamonadaceae bacterium]|jgi:hypothetical protein|nr:hypothetical protein [Dysgonamonadaceae bacterium]